LNDLNEYLKKVKSFRLENHQWCPGIELSEEALTTLHIRHFTETESGMQLKPVEERVQQSKVIELISAELAQDNGEELQHLEHAWAKEFVSEQVTDSSSKLFVPAVAEKRSYKKTLVHKRSVSARSNSSVSIIN
jgi:hypothetical protein